MSEWTKGFCSGAMAGICSLAFVNSDWAMAATAFAAAVVFILIEQWLKPAD